MKAVLIVAEILLQIPLIYLAGLGARSLGAEGFLINILVVIAALSLYRISIKLND